MAQYRLSSAVALESIKFESLLIPGKPISLLAANAGVGGGGPVMSSPAKEWEWVMGVNLFGVASTIRHFVPGMVEQGKPGAIVVSGQPLSWPTLLALCCAAAAPVVPAHS